MADAAVHYSVLADSRYATSYRWSAAGTVEHYCTLCAQWLPATAAHFNRSGPGRLYARCRACMTRQRSREAHSHHVPLRAEPVVDELASTVSTHLPDPLGDERQCKCCGARHPLDATWWPRAGRHGFAPICLDCSTGLHARARATARGHVFDDRTTA